MRKAIITTMLIPFIQIQEGLNKDRYFNYLQEVEFSISSDDFVLPSTIRGIRNNNWGNIEKGLKWKGLSKKVKDPRFCNFIDPIFGIRAIIRITRSYKRRYKIDTVEKWTNRWAPPHENKTNLYANYIISKTGSNEIKVDDYDYMKSFVKAVCEMENGIKEIDSAWNNWYFSHAWIIV